MRAGAALFVLIAVAIAPLAARAEQLTIALSTTEVRIDSNFTGTTLTVFGVIERDATTVSRPAGYEVAVVLRGPPETVVARRKDPILGIWINNASETLVDAPSFYSIAASATPDRLGTATLLERYGIGLDHLSFAYAGRDNRDDPRAAEFRAAFLRLGQESGLYFEDLGAVKFIGDSVFRSNLRIPANVPDGDYTLTVYLLSGGVLLQNVTEHISITKTGFERFTFMAAHQQAPLYGLACVALALFTGWLAGVIFRRD
jgi:uncharacterized protein (TIGR02186 family)